MVTLGGISYQQNDDYLRFKHENIFSIKFQCSIVNYRLEFGSQQIRMIYIFNASNGIDAVTQSYYQYWHTVNFIAFSAMQ